MLLTAAAAVAEEIPVLGSPEWWSEFLRSPGFGGAAALLAAIAGVVTVLLRAKADRGIAKEDREAADLRAAAAHKAEADAARQLREQELEDSAATHWWDMYRWTLDKIDVLDPDRAATLLEALDAQAPGEAERTLVSVAGDLLIASAQVEGGDDDGTDSTDDDPGRVGSPGGPGTV